MEYNDLYEGLYGYGELPLPLSTEEMKKNFELVKKGDIKAKETIMLHNLRLIKSIAYSKFSYVKDREELIDAGVIALLNAVDSFDLDRGFKFSTYASKLIWIAMFKTIKHSSNLSIDAPVSFESDTSLKDVLVNESDFTEELEAQHSRIAAVSSLSILSVRERYVIERRHGFVGPVETIDQVAEEFCVTQGTVRRIEKKAKVKLREYLQSRGVTTSFTGNTSTNYRMIK